MKKSMIVLASFCLSFINTNSMDQGSEPVSFLVRGTGRSPQSVMIYRHGDGYHLKDIVSQLDKKVVGIDSSSQKEGKIQLIFSGEILPDIISDQKARSILSLGHPLQVVIKKSETPQEKAERDGRSVIGGNAESLIREYAAKSSGLRTVFFDAYLKAAADYLRNQIRHLFLGSGELYPQFQNNSNILSSTIYEMIAMGVQLEINPDTYEMLITDVVTDNLYDLSPTTGSGARLKYKVDFLKALIKRILTGEKHW